MFRSYRSVRILDTLHFRAPLWGLGDIDRELVTSAKKSRILTNFPKLKKKFVKIR